MNKLICLLFLLALSFVGMSQENKNDSDQLGTFFQTIQKSKLNHIKLLTSINGGELIIDKNENHLADINFEYSKDDWDPSVSFTETDNLGKIQIKALTEGDTERVNDHNRCHISLADNYTYSLGILLGAGVANLDFENYQIEKALFRMGVGSFKINLANTSVPLLKIEAGIGEAKIDLSGKWNNDLSAQIKAGIGDITFTVPKDVGVKFTISGFLGDIKTPGYSKNNKEYTNALYGKTKNQLNFTVNGAIGSITIAEK